MLLDEARKLKSRTDIYITEEQHVKNLENKVNQLEKVIDAMSKEIDYLSKEMAYLEGLVAQTWR